MKKALLDILICPSCLPDENALNADIESQDGDDILSGALKCPQCGRAFPIKNGVANLDPAINVQSSSDLRYETSQVLSSYLWSHFGDLLGHEQASDAYSKWAKAMTPRNGFALDIGGAVGRFSFEMSNKSDFSVGLDKSASFIQAARELCRKGKTTFSLAVEGDLTREVTLQLPREWRLDKVEFIVADALFLPFRSRSFSSVSGLNLIDKVPSPYKHFMEMNRIAQEKDAQFLFSDPFSWSEDVAGKEEWLGGASSGPYSGRGLENVMKILQGRNNGFSPPWKVQDNGHVWWKIRTHSNHYELIRSLFIKAVR